MTRKYLSKRWDVLAPPPVEFVPRTEHEEARRVARDWLRERDDDDLPEWEDEPNSSWV